MCRPIVPHKVSFEIAKFFGLSDGYEKFLCMCSRTRENNENKVGPILWDTLYNTDQTKQGFWHKPMFAYVEGWCCSPIIRKQFCCSETVPTMESCPMSMTPHEQHTLGRGPGRVVRSSLPQGVSLSPAASRKCHTR